jgi:hypothetical protein
VVKLTILHDGGIGEIDGTGDNAKDVAAVRDYLKSRGLRSEPSVVSTMLAAAKGFADTSSRLYREYVRAKPPRVGGFIPFVVNSAFSVELYLKTLGKLFGVDLRGHDLLELYEALPAAAREQIDLISAACAKNQGLPPDTKYADCVQKHRRAFEEWRYLYEKKRPARSSSPR